jgi:sensor domain CHASE-containing protein
MTQMNHVYILPNKKQQTILNTIKSFIAYIKKRWQYKVRILRNDQDRSLGKEYSNWLDETSITEEYSAIYIAKQNRAIKRSRGVLINRSTALRLEANLPKLVWSEIYKAAGYILNRLPTRALNWKTPLALL